LRFLLDTFIGANDGVPFTIPSGAKQLCDTNAEFRGAEIPDWVQARESDDLINPGTIAQLQLKLAGKLDLPDRVTLGAYPGPGLRSLDPRCRQMHTLWEVPVLPIKSLRPDDPMQPPGDSAVVMYWNEKALGPGEAREVGFTYGLGRLSSAEGKGRLALTG